MCDGEGERRFRSGSGVRWRDDIPATTDNACLPMPKARGRNSLGDGSTSPLWPREFTHTWRMRSSRIAFRISY